MMAENPQSDLLVTFHKAMIDHYFNFDSYVHDLEDILIRFEERLRKIDPKACEEIQTHWASYTNPSET